MRSLACSFTWVSSAALTKQDLRYDGHSRSFVFQQGVMYLELVSIPLTFREVYKFSLGSSGLVYVTQVIGSFLGFFLEGYCGRLYARNVAKRGTEARLYTACELPPLRV